MKVFVSQAIKIPLSFLAEFLINTVLWRKNVQVHHMEEDDCDLRTLREAIDEVKHLQRASGNIHGEQDSFGTSWGSKDLNLHNGIEVPN
jgi:hypothetical protein